MIAHSLVICPIDISKVDTVPASVDIRGCWGGKPVFVVAFTFIFPILKALFSHATLHPALLSFVCPFFGRFFIDLTALPNNLVTSNMASVHLHQT